MNLVDVNQIEKFVEQGVKVYGESALVVAQYLDDLRERLQNNKSVDIAEINIIQSLEQDNAWEHPNHATKIIYRLMNQLKKDY